MIRLDGALSPNFQQISILSFLANFLMKLRLENPSFRIPAKPLLYNLVFANTTTTDSENSFALSLVLKYTVGT